ncbi:MAG: vancomycin high temperature exclusion protein [Lachnospiraceae bacterium]
MNWKKWAKKLLIIVIGVAGLGLIVVLGLNCYVVESVKSHILTEEEAAQLTDMDCILVLGCQVKSNGEPSSMLADRLKQGVALYELQAAPKLLMSGDHGSDDYNEVQVMKNYAMEAGVTSSDVFMDHAGFSTYESMYRAREVFGVKKMIIVTQEYHLYRALYIAEKLGIEAYGVAADYRSYYGQEMRNIREAAARIKDVVSIIMLPLPTYLGEQISIRGNGDLTND